MRCARRSSTPLGCSIQQDLVETPVLLLQYRLLYVYSHVCIIMVSPCDIEESCLSCTLYVGTPTATNTSQCPRAYRTCTWPCGVLAVAARLRSHLRAEGAAGTRVPPYRAASPLVSSRRRERGTGLCLGSELYTILVFYLFGGVLLAEYQMFEAYDSDPGVTRAASLLMTCYGLWWLPRILNLPGGLLGMTQCYHTRIPCCMTL